MQTGAGYSCHENQHNGVKCPNELAEGRRQKAKGKKADVKRETSDGRRENFDWRLAMCDL